LEPSPPPSRRIRTLFREYSKPLHGELIAECIGIESIRAECPNFSEWLKTLETLAS